MKPLGTEYENAKASTGDFVRLPAGGYVARITAVENTEGEKPFLTCTYDIAEVMKVTGTTVANIENGRNTSPIAIQLYGIVLERYWAYERGYVPAYRKVGQNKYYEGVMI